MNNYDKMKELIQENKLQEALLLAFSNSLKLKITTKSKADEEKAMETIINLLRGVSNRISEPDLINYPQKQNLEEIDIVNFHEQQKKIAYELWHKNRETLIRILQIIAGNFVEINSPQIQRNKVVTVTEKEEETFEEFEEKLNFAQSNDNDSFEGEENSLEDDNWVNGIVDDIVGEAEEEEEIISEEEDTPQENWDDFAVEDETNEAEVIINVDEEEENWDELMDSDYVEDSVINGNGVSFDNSSEGEEEGEWQEWLEDSPSAEESVINNNGVVETDSTDLEVGDEWQEWLEDENVNDSESIGEEMDEIDWSEEDWQQEKVN